MVDPPRGDLGDVDADDGAALRGLLARALDRGQIWPAFQPIVDLRTGAVASFEILARWRDPTAGDIGPATFIPRLERHGLIGVLSEALMHRACTEAATWPGQFSLAFNVSPTQLLGDDLMRQLAAVATSTGFPSSRMELEVTEASLITDDDRAYDVLRAVDDLGIRIGIDDFGTGHSSLARLESLPFHTLKLDARFVREVDTDAGKRRIAAATIGLGHSLGITVVAEGIETASAESILRGLGCDLGQGWHYGRGTPAAEARHVLEARGSESSPRRPLGASPFQQLHQLANLYEKAPVGLCFLDTGLRHVRANDRFASIHGLTSSQIEGTTISDLMGGETLRAVAAVLAEAAATDQPIPLDYVFRGRDVRIIATRVEDLAGEMLGYSIVAIDITDENRLKATLVASEQRLRRELTYATAIIDSLPGSFYYYDADLRLRQHNKNMERLTGYTADELRRTHPLDLCLADDRARVADAIRQTLTEGHAQVEAHLLAKDGRAIPLLLTGARLEADGQAGFVGVGVDISELRSVQRALQERTSVFEAMLHTSPDGILLVDRDGERLVQNQRLNELWGIPDDIAAVPDFRAQLEFCLTRVTDPAQFAEDFARLQARPDEAGTGEVELVDGTVLRYRRTPLLDAGGNLCGRVWVFRPAG